MKWTLALVLALLLLSPVGYARRTSGSHPSSSHSHSRSVHTRSHTHAQRRSHGRIKRSETAKREFMRQTGYPHGRKGYVVDHIVPLACGGADDPSNMQWQTVAEAKAKDKVERRGCK